MEARMSEHNDTATPEVWKRLTGYKHAYEISDTGNLRRLLANGRWKPVKGRVSTRGGYRQYSLRLPDGTMTQPYGHQLVLTAFVGPCPDGLVGRHENDTPLDNRLSNLSWGTQKENIHDAIRNGTLRNPPVMLGTEHPNAKLNPDQVREIRRMANEGMDHGRVGAIFGIQRANVWSIANRRIWKHVE
jgi:hypothetical protein